jgi:hypothetical protein
MAFDSPLEIPLPEAGVKIPIWATFTGWRGVPMLALGINNFAPLLRLHEDRVEFKVFRTHTRPLSDITRIDARRLGKTSQITIEWRGENLTFSANILTPRLRLQVLAFLDAKGVPLSDAARTLMETA